MTVPQMTASPEEMASQVEPTLRRYAAMSEAERRLAPEVVAALHDTGLFRTWVPRAFGGLEMDPLPALTLFEELARIDASAGWVVANSAGLALICQIVADDFAAEMFTDPHALMAGAAGPPATALPVAGGYRVSGQWPFASGCHYATWLHGTGLIMDGDGPRLGPDDNPLMLLAFFPPAEAEILDTWHTLGLRGTGSHDIRVTDIFVPEHHSVVMSSFEHPGSAYSGPLYRLGMWVGGLLSAAVALGIARAALDDLLALAAAKTPSYTLVSLADRSVVQDRVARARALIDTGRSYMHATVADAWEFVQTGKRITVNEGVPLGLAASFGVEAAVQAVDLCMQWRARAPSAMNARSSNTSATCIPSASTPSPPRRASSRSANCSWAAPAIGRSTMFKHMGTPAACASPVRGRAARV